MFSLESSKFIERDAIEPSGLVTPPSHSPVNGTGVADGTGVSDGTGDAVGTETVLGAAQAVTKSIKRRVKDMRRMDGSIFYAVLILTTLRRGIVGGKGL